MSTNPSSSRLSSSSFAIVWFWTILAQSQADTFDAIIVGAGAGGSPLAQTLIEGGKTVLLLERGGERPEASLIQNTADQALLDAACTEVLPTKSGTVAAVGRCMGGSTSINQGVWTETTPGFFYEEEGISPQTFFSPQEIMDAGAWVRSRVAPDPRTRRSAAAQAYIDELVEINTSLNVSIANIDPGQPAIPEEGMWTTHSIFDLPNEGRRRSADTLLDRESPLLTVMTDAQVNRVVFREVEGRHHAECVDLANEASYCVKSGGRIYLAAGAFYTPQILVQSGIGPNGTIYDNRLVGQGLSDKPAVFAIGNFGENYTSTEPTIGDLALLKKIVLSDGTEKTVLAEEVTWAVTADVLLTLGAFERSGLPNSLKFGPFADATFAAQAQCIRQIQAGTPVEDLDPACQLTLVMFQAGCFSNAFINAGLVSDPTSKGRVLVDDADGSLDIDLGHLTTPDDIEAMGAVTRHIYHVFESLSLLQQPCSADADPTCQSCPDFYKLLADGTSAQILNVIPDFPIPPEAPASVLASPNVIEFLINAGVDDATLGEAMRESVVSPHHFAGTSRLGDVVDLKFKVKGVEGLYVADASVLPKTTGANSMATTMTVGRLAGIAFLEETASDPSPSPTIESVSFEPSSSPITKSAALEPAVYFGSLTSHALYLLAALLL